MHPKITKPFDTENVRENSYVGQWLSVSEFVEENIESTFDTQKDHEEAGYFHTICKNLQGKDIHFLKVKNFDSLTVDLFSDEIEGLFLSASTIDLRNTSLCVTNLYIRKDINGDAPAILVDSETSLTIRNFYIEEGIFFKHMVGALIDNVYIFSNPLDLGIYDSIDNIDFYAPGDGINFVYDLETIDGSSPIGELDIALFEGDVLAIPEII